MAESWQGGEGRSLLELELLTLEESLPGEGVSLLGLPRTEGTGSSQPLRFPKVMRALRMWKIGISMERDTVGRHPHPASHLSPAPLPQLTSQKVKMRWGVSPILTGKPGGRRSVMKSRSLAKSALLTAMRSMMGATCSHRDRGCSSHSHSLALNLPPPDPKG